MGVGAVGRKSRKQIDECGDVMTVAGFALKTYLDENLVFCVFNMFLQDFADDGGHK